MPLMQGLHGSPARGRVWGDADGNPPGAPMKALSYAAAAAAVTTIPDFADRAEPWPVERHHTRHLRTLQALKDVRQSACNAGFSVTEFSMQVRMHGACPGVYYLSSLSAAVPTYMQHVFWLCMWHREQCVALAMLVIVAQGLQALFGRIPDASPEVHLAKGGLRKGDVAGDGNCIMTSTAVATASIPELYEQLPRAGRIRLAAYMKQVCDTEWCILCTAQHASPPMMHTCNTWQPCGAAYTPSCVTAITCRA